MMKGRSSAHERKIRELQASGSEVMQVGSALKRSRSMLAGVPEYVGETALLPGSGDGGGQ